MRAARLILVVTGCAAGAEGLAALLGQIREAHAAGRRQDAVRLADRTVSAYPADGRAWRMRGGLREDSGDYRGAESDYARAIRLEPASAGLYNLRGGVRFKQGRIEASIEDFDRAIALDPAQEPHHWQRGIAYYYAGRYADGQRQFERHRTVNAEDVENAVWHFLCKARVAGVEEARKTLIPVRDDGRIPMAEIHRLFAGEATVEQVLAAAGRGAPGQRTGQAFYAHLYVGLYYEAAGDAGPARRHLERAVRDFPARHYMGEVARVHVERLRRGRH